MRSVPAGWSGRVITASPPDAATDHRGHLRSNRSRPATRPTCASDGTAPNVEDHRLAADRGQRLAGQARRGHAGGNKDDRIRHDPQTEGFGALPDRGPLRTERLRLIRVANRPAKCYNQSRAAHTGGRRLMERNVADGAWWMVMDSFEFNKIAGAVLGTLLITMGLGIVSGFVFAPNTARQAGLCAARRAGPGDRPMRRRCRDRAGRTAAGAARQGRRRQRPGVRQGLRSLPQFREGRRRRRSGRRSTAWWAARSRRSRASPIPTRIKAKGGVWSYEEINKFITNPKGDVNGTKMGYAGEPSPEKRADIIDYLHTLADTPEPLPAP